MICVLGAGSPERLSPSTHPLPGNETNTCLCLNATVCEVFRKGYLMLYPFSTEYCLICCAVLFVMWKNVGRRLASHAGPHPSTPAFHLHGAIFGPLLGLLALVAGVCVFVLFQIEASGPAIARQYFTLYYAFYVAVLPAMSLACLAGTAIHGLEERELDTLKNPTRSLDVVLLMGAALGQVGIAYFSIVAIVATHPQELLNRLILAYSLLLILQHITQNLFIIEGLHRRPLWEMPPEGLAGKCEAQPPRRGSLLELGQDLRRASLAYIHSYNHLNWKRRMLKEISLFLILCNITVSGWAGARAGVVLARRIQDSGSDRSRSRASFQLEQCLRGGSVNPSSASCPARLMCRAESRFPSYMCDVSALHKLTV